jgi:hypothetical protein
MNAHLEENPEHGGVSSTDAEGNEVFWVCTTCNEHGGNVPNHIAVELGIAEPFDPSKPIPPKEA